MSARTSRSIAVGLALLLGACSGSSGSAGEGGSGPSRFDPLPGMEVREGQVPITESDETLILKAETRLTNRCMEEQGFPATTQVEQFAHPEPPPYLSPSELRRGGYQFDFGAEARSEASVNGTAGPATITDGMSPGQRAQYDMALNGPPKGPTASLPSSEGGASTPTTGCAARAREELYGSIPNYLRYDRAWQGSNLSALRDQLIRDRDYREPLEAWQTCMAGAGTVDLTADLADGLDYGVTALRRMLWVAVASGDGPLEQAAIDAVAQADARCQESSGLYEVRARLLPRAEAAVLEDLGLEASELIAFQNAVLEKAKSVR